VINKFIFITRSIQQLSWSYLDLDVEYHSFGLSIENTVLVASLPNPK